ncbi:MAG: 4-hydroxythreonine-4-phosphate dehydrogenase [Pseudomonadota bacterium]|nr:4-hydroxythreonine-4-phosphate dehydrogenase [Pseudomonadota bacterium]
MNLKKTIFVTSGEPAGIGPDICLDIVKHDFFSKYPRYTIVVVGDIELLKHRANLLRYSINLEEITSDDLPASGNANTLYVLNVLCKSKVIPGVLNSQNSSYVLATLDKAITLCKEGKSNIVVTAPVNKEVINQSGVNFVGHTEYFAAKLGKNKVVMMLANQMMKVALLTTHLPLKDVAHKVTADNLNQTLKIIIDSFANYGIPNPKIAVCGLNPHAGEGGYLGDEELTTINPVIQEWQNKGYNVSGSYPSDTVFLQAHQYDVILAMYHDQGLPVLKYSGFATGINVTLGLPIIRTSVDHGTALEIAGTGRADSSSLIHAIEFAINCDK